MHKRTANSPVGELSAADNGMHHDLGAVTAHQTAYTAKVTTDIPASKTCGKFPASCRY